MSKRTGGDATHSPLVDALVHRYKAGPIAEGALEMTALAREFEIRVSELEATIDGLSKLNEAQRLHIKSLNFALSETAPRPASVNNIFDIEPVMKNLVQAKNHRFVGWEQEQVDAVLNEAIEVIMMQDDMIERPSVPSAIAPQWVSVLDRLPEGFDDVLVAHPVYAKTSRDMFGIEIRSASTVRKWVGDAEDTSMHGAYWQVLPKGPQ